VDARLVVSSRRYAGARPWVTAIAAAEQLAIRDCSAGGAGINGLSNAINAVNKGGRVPLEARWSELGKFLASIP
jgi:hypothetical protein